MTHTHIVGAAGLCNVDEMLAMKARLLVPFNSLWDDVRACVGLTVDQKDAFRWELEAFRKWISRSPPLCFADAEIREGQDFESKYNKWRALLTSTNCTPSDPALDPLPDTDPRSPNYKPPDGIFDKYAGLLKTIAIIGGIGAGVYGLVLVAPVISAWASGKAASMNDRRAISKATSANRKRIKGKR